MESVALVVLWSLLFGGTHIVMATQRIRAVLVERLGEAGFRLLYSGVAAGTFLMLVRTFALHQHVGPPGIGGFVGPAVRWVLWSVAGLGATLMVAGFVAYPGSPMDLAGSRVRRPAPLARITRHPFFVGLAVVGIVHMLLASHATGTVFFGGLVLVTIVGLRHQDRKLLGAKGEPYAEYCRETSVVPFAAIVSGRTGLSARELPMMPLAIGLGGAIAIRWLHPVMLAWNGMALAAGVVGSAALVGVTGFVRFALRAGHGPALATAGAFLVLQVGLAHEFVGTRLYPDGPERLGGLVAWHAVGVAGIAAGLALIAGALGMLALPSRVLAAVVGVAGLGLVATDAVVHGGFHFFAATLVVGAVLVVVASEGRRAPRSSAAPG